MQKSPEKKTNVTVEDAQKYFAMQRRNLVGKPSFTTSIEGGKIRK